MSLYRRVINGLRYSGNIRSGHGEQNTLDIDYLSPHKIGVVTMHLKKLEMRNLYGTLDKVVNFNQDLNLLVGINGSGKTSVLNIIDWLLSPNLQKMCVTPFDKLTLTFSYDRSIYTIEAVQKGLNFSLNLKKSGKNLYAPIKVKLQRNPLKIDPSEVDSWLERYEGLKPETSELPLWSFMSKLPKPVVIALDRSISAEVNNRVYMDIEPRVAAWGRKNIRNISPLDKVREVTSSNFNTYRFTVAALNERLKARIVMSALRVPETGQNAAKIKVKTDKDIDQLEQKVISYLSASIRDIDVIKPIKSFFKRSKALTQTSVSSETVQQGLFSTFYANQLMQIDEMAQAFNEFETNSANAYEKLKSYLDTVNLFLADSKKKIIFSQPSNILSFYAINEAGSLDSEAHPIDHLSSGEKQILILFTFLAFVAEDNRIFIVDEPELSLHPKWQSEFTQSFLRLKPKLTQLLLATHSPEIVGNHKSDCVVLLP